MPTTNMKHETLEAIADKVVALFAVGNTDPHAAEIHAALEADDDAPAVSSGSVLGSLCDVKALLLERGHYVYLVADPYYEKYGREAPETEAQARDCLPQGRGKQSVGIRLWRGMEDADLIAYEWLRATAKQGAGKIAATMERALDGQGDGLLSAEMLFRLIAEADSRMKPVREQLPLSDTLQIEGPK